MSLRTAALAACLLCAALRATDYYVDPVSGNDRRPGTQAAPWRTLTRATRAGQVYQRGDRIFVSDGTCSAANGEAFPISMPPEVLIAARNLLRVHVDAGNAPCFAFDRAASYGNASGLVDLVATGAPVVAILPGTIAADVEPLILGCELHGDVAFDRGSSPIRLYPRLERNIIHGTLRLRSLPDGAGFGAAAGHIRLNAID